MDLARGAITGVSVNMALRADGLRIRADFGVRGMEHGVIAMTNHAAWKASGVKSSFVRALGVELRLEDVAC